MILEELSKSYSIFFNHYFNVMKQLLELLSSSVTKFSGGVCSLGAFSKVSLFPKRISIIYKF